MSTMITTTTTTSISLAKLVPSPANVRRTGAGAGIEALAASIQAHGLLQSLVVQPRLDGTGQPTGRYEVVAGARRLAALKLLAKQKRLATATPIPCRVLDGAAGSGFEVSLAENVVRQDMHPADQFEAFAALHEGGMGLEDIAARFGVSVPLVRQRLRLALVSPALIQAYREAVLTLDHLMAFAVTEDQAAQDQVFGQLQAWQRSPDTIRRLLTHALLPTTDRKALFVGLEAYAAAGGTVQRDLFSEDRGGWIADPTLLERLVAERLDQEAAAIRAEGWRWVGIGTDVQAEAWKLRRVFPSQVSLSPEDEQRRDELARRYDELAEEHNRSADNLPEEVAAELDRLEAELAVLDARTEVFRAEDIAVAGVVITLTLDGSLRIERGFVRAEDEEKPVLRPSDGDSEGDGAAQDGIVTTLRPNPPPEKEKVPTLPSALLAELEAHRTAGLQAALVGQPELALQVLLHGLATDAFYHRYGETIAAFHAVPPTLAACPGIGDSPARQALAEVETLWRTRLPQVHEALWGWLQRQSMATLLSLLAVCVARATNAGNGVWTTPEGSQGIAAQVASAAGLDMRSCWTATADSYLGRVPKALILDAVGEAAGAGVANRMAGSKKEAMVADAARLLDGTGWLPMMLRVPAAIYPEDSGDAGGVATQIAAE